MSNILEAIVILYFRDITAAMGIPIAVLVYHDDRVVDLHTRKDWQPVLTYDENAEIEFLKSFVLEISTIKQDASKLTLLAGAENSIRIERLAGSGPLFARKLADALRGLA